MCILGPVVLVYNPLALDIPPGYERVFPWPNNLQEHLSRGKLLVKGGREIQPNDELRGF